MKILIIIGIIGLLILLIVVYSTFVISGRCSRLEEKLDREKSNELH